MTCEACEIAIGAYYDGEGTSEEQPAMFTHLQSCQECRQFFRDVLQFKTAALTEGRIAPPHRLDVRIMGDGKSHHPGAFVWDAARRIARMKITLPVPVAVVLAIALVVGATYLYRHPDKTVVPEPVHYVGTKQGMSLPVIRISEK